MRIAVASGKGGTGKTTVATSLALSLASDARHPLPLFIDCDVEAPNAHLFLRPEFDRRLEVGILIPRVDEPKCTRCGKCAEVCQYHSIAVLGRKVLVFKQLCHGCGSCSLICPEHAIAQRLNVMGVLESGKARANIAFARGVLNVGESMAVPLIRQLRLWTALQPNPVVILDVPPGTSCPVVESVRGADFVLLVTEPTPFGLHDLKLAVQIVRELNIRAGVVINRDGIGDTGVADFCATQELPVLLRIPHDRAIAEGIACGKALVDIRAEFTARFVRMFAQMDHMRLAR
jgi:MinD superfamily P-loop ATPase